MWCDSFNISSCCELRGKIWGRICNLAHDGKFLEGYDFGTCVKIQRSRLYLNQSQENVFLMSSRFTRFLQTLVLFSCMYLASACMATGHQLQFYIDCTRIRKWCVIIRISKHQMMPRKYRALKKEYKNSYCRPLIQTLCVSCGLRQGGDYHYRIILR